MTVRIARSDHLRSIPIKDAPPSVRGANGEFKNEAAALADFPKAGDIYEIDGRLFYYKNRSFVPLCAGVGDEGVATVGTVEEMANPLANLDLEALAEAKTIAQIKEVLLNAFTD